MADAKPVIQIDPEILGGTAVFIGTRVPVQALIDYLEGNHPLSDFLDDFPSVSHAQAVALEHAKELLVTQAGSMSACQSRREGRRLFV